MLDALREYLLEKPDLYLDENGGLFVGRIRGPCHKI
jgi:hypothetical protein